MRRLASMSRRWVVALVVVAVLIVGGATAAVLSSRHDETPTAGDDCALVAELGQQWTSMVSEVGNAFETGAGEPDDYIAIAKRESAVAKELRSGVNSVSSPEIKRQLAKWADAATLFAQTQQEIAVRPPGTPPPPGSDDVFISASFTANEAAEALTALCPGLPWG